MDSAARLLHGYDVKFLRGDPLVIQNGNLKAFLPMHQVWIVVIGLLGRSSVETKSPLTKSWTLSLFQENAPRIGWDYPNAREVGDGILSLEIEGEIGGDT
jgi:hypothetical protein